MNRLLWVVPLAALVAGCALLDGDTREDIFYPHPPIHMAPDASGPDDFPRDPFRLDTVSVEGDVIELVASTSGCGDPSGRRSEAANHRPSPRGVRNRSG